MKQADLRLKYEDEILHKKEGRVIEPHWRVPFQVF